MVYICTYIKLFIKTLFSSSPCALDPCVTAANTGRQKKKTFNDINDICPNNRNSLEICNFLYIIIKY